MEQQIKSVKADIMARHPESSIGAKEMAAFSNQEYRDHLVRAAHAMEEYEELRLLRDYHMALIECWRTACSNQRALGNFR